MKVLFPKQTITHKRRPKQVAEPVFMVGGKILSWEEAQRIYFEVQREYDRMDVKHEIEYQWEDGNYTDEQVKDAMNHLEEIADRLRGRLDDSDGDNWSHTFSDILWEFNQRKEQPWLW